MGDSYRQDDVTIKDYFLNLYFLAKESGFLLKREPAFNLQIRNSLILLGGKMTSYSWIDCKTCLFSSFSKSTGRRIADKIFFGKCLRAISDKTIYLKI